MYNQLIRAHGRRRDPDRAWDVYCRLRQAAGASDQAGAGRDGGLPPPNAYTYTLTMDALSKARARCAAAAGR